MQPNHTDYRRFLDNGSPSKFVCFVMFCSQLCILTLFYFHQEGSKTADHQLNSSYYWWEILWSCLRSSSSPILFIFVWFPQLIFRNREDSFPLSTTTVLEFILEKVLWFRSLSLDNLSKALFQGSGILHLTPRLTGNPDVNIKNLCYTQ